MAFSRSPFCNLAALMVCLNLAVPLNAGDGDGSTPSDRAPSHVAYYFESLREFTISNSKDLNFFVANAHHFVRLTTLHVNLSGHSIGDAGAEALATALGRLTNLTTLQCGP